MAPKGAPRKDPWKELTSRRENQQVEIDEVLRGLSVETHTAQTLKKALMARVTRLMRTS